MRENSKKALAEGYEAGQMQHLFWGQVVHLQSVVGHNSPSEGVQGETHPAIDEGGLHHQILGVGIGSNIILVRSERMQQLALR